MLPRLFVLSSLLVALAAICSAQAESPSSALPRWRQLINQSERIAADIAFTQSGVTWDSDSAISLALTALAAINDSTSAGDTARVYVLTDLGDYYFRTRAYQKADSCWNRAEVIGAKIWTPLDVDRRVVIWRLMLAAKRAGDSSRADSLFAAALRDSIPESTTFLRTSRFHELAQVCTKLILLKDNWHYHEMAVQAWRDNPACEAHSVVIALLDLAEGASKLTFTNVQNRYLAQDSAISLANTALELTENRFGPDDILVGYVLNRLGDYYARRGADALAESSWQRAYAINTTKRAPEDIEYQGSISRIGSLAAAKGDFVLAERLLTKAVELRRLTQGAEHQEVASMLSSAASLYRQMGNFEQARRLLLEALSIRRKALPANHPDIAISLNSLGSVSFDLGDRAEAEKYWREALAIRIKILGPTHLQTVGTMQNLADLYNNWGRTTEAIEMQSQVVESKRAFLGPNHPELVSSMNRLACLLLANGQVDKASKIGEEAGAMLIKQSDSLNTGWLQTMAAIRKTQNRNLDSDSLLSLAIGILERSYGAEAFQLISPMLDRARVLASLGRENDAIAAYVRINRIVAANALNQNPINMGIQEGYGDLLRKKGNRVSAESLYTLAYSLATACISDGARVMPERLATEYQSKARGLLNKLLSIHTDQLYSRQPEQNNRQGDSSSILFYSALASGKSEITDIVVSRNEAISNSNDPDIAWLLDSLNDTNLRISRLYVEDTRSASEGAFDRKLERLSRTKQELEQRLFQENYDQAAATSRDHQPTELLPKSVPVDRAFVDFYAFEYVDSLGRSGESRYAAFVLTSDGLESFDLGLAKSIDINIASIQKNITSIALTSASPDKQSCTDYQMTARRLYDKIWKPIEKSLSAKKQVFVSPDGNLSTLSFAGLPRDEHSYLIESYSLAYLGSLREFGQEQPDRSYTGTSSLLAIGAPDFNADRDQRLANLQGKADKNQSARYASSRGSTSSCAIPTDDLLPLVASGYEAEGVSRQWQKLHRDQSLLLIGAAASEENFKSLSPRARFIHVATHAYCQSEMCESATSDIFANHPLLRSGLLFAGAAIPNSAGDSDDGVLTGEEIASMDLHSTECVVLSACESGLGKTSKGEGIQSLSRAFRLAGVRSVVSTLWKIPDQSTLRLMRNLYQSIDTGLVEALRLAQLESIREQRETGLPMHPYAWGAFMVSGN